MTAEAAAAQKFRLMRPVDPGRDHVRGGEDPRAVTVVVYADYLCPYCRRLRRVLLQLRDAMGERMAYVFRHFPNERAHPGAELVARAAEAAGRQGRFWEMHDSIYEHEPSITRDDVLTFARDLKLDLARFETDLDDAATARHVTEDIEGGRRNGVTGTPSIFIDGIRYDGAWDFHSMLEELQRPVANRLQRSARVFAALPASGGFVLLLAAALALLAANSPLAPFYHALMHSAFGLGPESGMLALSVGEWCSEGLLAIFFLLVGLEIRREMTAGSLSDARAAALPVLAAIGGVLAPAGIYLAINSGVTAPGWSIPTATDIAFTLGILALLGSRVPSGLRVFVAALAVVDDILSVLTLAIFYPQEFQAPWLFGAVLATLALYALNRWRVYAIWPYLVATVFLWLALHAAGVHAALAGVILAAFVPTRPAPSAAPLLAQAATALSSLEFVEREAREDGREVSAPEQEAVWEWASRNLSAASDRLLSPADRMERAVSPWSAYVVLPLFAFSATGIGLRVDLAAPGVREIAEGIILGLVIGKPLGIAIATWLAIKTRIAVALDGVTVRNFLGAACLCGVGFTVAVLMTDQAFHTGPLQSAAKIAVLAGSFIAAAIGSAILLTTKPERAS